MKDVKRVVIIGSAVIAVFLIAMGIIFLTQNQGANSSISNLQVSMGTTHNIVITDNMFTPSQIIIKAGDRIVWANNGAVGHTATSDSGNEIESSLLLTGQTYSHIFTASGTYNYHCSVYPSMMGQIIVQ